MKRIISLFISISLIMTFVPIEVSAESSVHKYLNVEYGDTQKTIECIYANDNIFCSGENLADMTEYTFYQIDDSCEYGFVREYDNYVSEPTLELQTEVSVLVDMNAQKAEVKAMHNSYEVDCYVEGEIVYFPMEDFVYLLHGNLISLPDRVFIEAMPYNIIDFYASYADDIARLASVPEDVLINTGWWGSETKQGQAIYSSIAEILKDFDGSLFVLYDPDVGHKKTAKFYENAILQLSKTDKELLGEKMYSDIGELTMDSLDGFNKAIDPIQKVGSLCTNIDETIDSIPDAVAILTELQNKYPDLMISKQFKQFSESLDTESSLLLSLEIPEIKARMKELGDISDAIYLLEISYNIYDVRHQINNWNSEFEAQLEILENYENPGWINNNVVKYVNSAAEELLKRKEDPTTAQIETAEDEILEFLIAKTFDASPFGKVLSALGGIQFAYGVLDQKSNDVWNAYTELGDVTYSIKIEQMVGELFKYDSILNRDEPLTEEYIETFRNQLMLFLRLDMRNKAQLYILNSKANADDEWQNSAEAQSLYDEIIEINELIIILRATQIVDNEIILESNYKESMGIINKELLTESELETNDTVDYSWKELYIDYLEHLDEHIRDNCYFSLIFVDDNDTPELFYNRGYTNPGGDCLVYSKGGCAEELIFIGELGSYIERSGKIRDNAGFMGFIVDDIYLFDEGEITMLASGSGNSSDIDGPRYDQNNNLIFEYEWNDQSVDEASYDRLLNEVYDTSKEVLFYNEENKHSYSEIIELIRNFGNENSNDDISDKDNAHNYEELYSLKVDIETRSSEIDERVEEIICQDELNKASYEQYNLWYDGLNDLWDIIEVTVTQKDFVELSADNSEWEESLANEMVLAGQEFEGGSMQVMIENFCGVEMIKTRFYYLYDWVDNNYNF